MRPDDISRQFGKYVADFRAPMFPRWAQEIRAIARCGCQRISTDGETWARVERCRAHHAEWLATQTPTPAGPTTSRGAFGDRGNE